MASQKCGKAAIEESMKIIRTSDTDEVIITCLQVIFSASRSALPRLYR